MLRLHVHSLVVNLASSLIAVTFCCGAEPFVWPKLDGLTVISPTTAPRLERMGRLGSCLVEQIAWAPDGRLLLIRSAEGVSVYRRAGTKLA